MYMYMNATPKYGQELKWHYSLKTYEGTTRKFCAHCGDVFGQMKGMGGNFT